MRQHPITTARAIALGALICVTTGATAAHAQTVHVKDDTNINVGMPTQINGTATSLFVRNIGSGGERHTFLQFDLSTVPSGVLINQAMLRIWVLAVNDPGPVSVYAVNGPWSEETLSAAVAPPLGALIGTVHLAVSDENRFVVTNITSAVQGWLNGSSPNFGIALVPSAGDPVRVTLDSKEATGTSHGPELEVAVIPTGDITAVAAGLGLTGGATLDVATLALDTMFTDARYAPTAHGHNVSQIANAATLGANTFAGSQSITGSVSASGNVSGQTANFSNGGSGHAVTISENVAGSALFATTTSSGHSAIWGRNLSTAGEGLRGEAGAHGVVGLASSTSGTSVEGVFGWATGASGINAGVRGRTESAAGVGGLFENAGSGMLLIGRVGFDERFRVDGAGAVYASSYRDLAGNPIPSGTGDITAVMAGVGLSGGAATGDATLGLDTVFTDARYAPAVHGHNVSAIAGAATLAANTFAGSQVIDTGSLDLDASTATAGNITKNGTRFLHNFGSRNAFVGSGAGNFVLTGADNTAAGSTALSSLAAGFGNTAVGSAALQANADGLSNTAIGVTSLQSNSTGSNNTAAGVNALNLNTTGDFNVALGSQAGFNGTTGSNNIYLGAFVLGVAGESNTMYLGKFGTQTKTVIAGVRGTTVTGGEMVVVDAAGRLGTAAVATGTDTVGSAQVIDESLTASDLAPNSVTGSELAAGSVTADKVGFNYAGSTTPGGAATDVVCLGCVAASEVSFSFAALGANTFTATQTIDTGNLDLDASTATTGNVTKNGTRFLHNSGPQNTFLGEGAGTFVVTGAQNSALGNQALTSLTSGVANTAIGQAALFGTTTGSSNTATGGGALSSTSTGSGNTATGRDALLYNTTGNSNTAVGHNSLLLNTTGQGNTAAGVSALGNNITGFGNTAMGGAALASNTAGFENTAIGGNALAQTTGSRNVAIGQSAGANATAGSNNIYLGSLVLGAAGESNTMYLGATQTKTVIAGIRGTTVTGGEMVVIDAAGRLGSATAAPGANTVGSAQVIDESLMASDLAPNSVTGSELAAGSVTADKVAFNYAGSASPGGAATDVVCLGCVAASEVSFSFAALGANTFTATQTINTGNLDLDPSSATTGTITKNGARFLHNFGTENTFLGVNAGNFAITGFFNTATGAGALSQHSTGNNNTANGAGALASNTAGGANTATGAFALRDNAGHENTASGTQALRNNTSGGGNTASGAFALLVNTTGNSNTVAGWETLLNNTTGSNNVAVGALAGLNATTGSNNIYLGANVHGVAGESNAMYLGGTQTKTLVAGIRGVTTVNADAIPVMIDSAGQLGTVSSSRRFKEDIRDMASTSQRLLQLRPVTFRYRQPFGDGSKPVQYGLIAEEVAEVFPELAVRGADGEVETVQYQTLSVLLLNELQKLQRAANRQEGMLREQRRNVQDQQERIELLEQRLNELLGQREVPSAKAPR